MCGLKVRKCDGEKSERRAKTNKNEGEKDLLTKGRRRVRRGGWGQGWTPGSADEQWKIGRGRWGLRCQGGRHRRAGWGSRSRVACVRETLDAGRNLALFATACCCGERAQEGCRVGALPNGLQSQLARRAVCRVQVVEILYSMTIADDESNTDAVVVWGGGGVQ